ncbi:MAG: MMPL family transporter, partial [Candidatus Thermoplasmatota archaeon]|nr:MMPL family transporter [Candidatus Thermoplasmatota archaeon]
MRRAEESTSRLASALEKYAMSIVIGSLLLTVLLVSQLVPLPEFSTDVSDFAPPNESEDRIEAIESEFPPQMSRIYVDVKSSDETENPLSIDALNTLYQKSDFVDELAQKHGVMIGSHINVARTLNTLIMEQSPSTDLSSMDDWGDIVDAIQNGEDCTSLAGENAVTSAASYAVSTLVSEDLVFDGICDYLDGIDGADPTPFATSTMWVIEVSEASDQDSVRSFSVELREKLSEEGGEAGFGLSYSVVSEDLVSEDINSGTLSNFTILLATSLIVIVGILAIAFRSTVMVAAPLVALTAALSWTYGLVALFGHEFTVLDIAVAPVILGLGIDYGIHLQRGYELNVSRGMKPARAWVESFDLLRLALSLSVITTVAAFLSNAFSPIIPLRAFGTTLAIGVVCAFTASTITVGAIHVVSERSAGRYRGRKPIEHSVWRRASRLQDKSLAKVVSIVAILTLASAAVSVGKLETSFELTDFLDDDMQSIEIRNEIYDNYEVEFVKTAIILIELTNEDQPLEDEDIMDTMRGLHRRMVLDEMVIRPDGTEDSRPQYEGLYTVLR